MLQQPGVMLTPAGAQRSTKDNQGLVESFQHWQIQQGYAIGSINIRLLMVKAYCKIAVCVDILDAQILNGICLMQGHRNKEGLNLDCEREATCKGSKKVALLCPRCKVYGPSALATWFAILLYHH